jgi:hypothetical protein
MMVLMGRTNIVIDDELVERAMRLYRLPTRRAAVDFAVPRSPRIRTPPMRVSTAFKMSARRMRSCPTIAVKGKMDGIYLNSEFLL